MIITRLTSHSIPMHAQTAITTNTHLCSITHVHPPTQTAMTKGTPGRLELVAADITQPATLLPEMFDGVKAVVNATAVKVEPKEGDTPDRAKYKQVLGCMLCCLLGWVGCVGCIVLG